MQNLHSGDRSITAPLAPTSSAPTRKMNFFGLFSGIDILYGESSHRRFERSGIHSTNLSLRGLLWTS
jgi:hypothetical protein